jgi:hypothetical protein
MNNQNILSFYGSKLDLKVDSSELYDFEVAKNQTDYDFEVLDFNNPIVYDTLKIDTTMSGFRFRTNTISLVEYDNTDNDGDYIYSALSFSLDYDLFTDYIDPNYKNTILNNDVYVFTGITGETHFFKIIGYGDNKYIDNRLSGLTENQVISGFTHDIIECIAKLEDTDNCCPLPPKLSYKPWAYKINSGSGPDNCSPIIQRRTEKGWTLDFVFNRQDLVWSDGGVFYYFGVRGDNDLSDYADNNLSFQFTPDGRIKWVSIRYSGVCDTVNGYDYSYYTSSGQTEQLCSDDPTKDFNISIVFDRYKRYTDCNLENDGGWNDLILGPHPIEYSNPLWENTGNTENFPSGSFQQVSTQIPTGYLITNSMDTITGATPMYSYIEELNKKWNSERERRLGTLKIYLNGNPIYKLEDWEEIIPSKRGTQPFIQSWGGGTGLMGGIHDNVCRFIIKKIQYYEEPLNYPHIKHKYITKIKPYYDIFECGIKCIEDLSGYFNNAILLGDNDNILTQDNNIILY